MKVQKSISLKKGGVKMEVVGFLSLLALYKILDHSSKTEGKEKMQVIDNQML